MWWDIIYCLLVLLPIGTLILNYINYRFNNKPINALSILSVTLWLSYIITKLLPNHVLNSISYIIGGELGIFLGFFIFVIVYLSVIVDISIIGYLFKNSNRKTSILCLWFIILSILLITTIILLNNCNITHTITYCLLILYLIVSAILTLLKISIPIFLFTFLLYKTIILLIQNIKDRIKQ